MSTIQTVVTSVFLFIGQILPRTGFWCLFMLTTCPRLFFKDFSIFFSNARQTYVRISVITVFLDKENIPRTVQNITSAEMKQSQSQNTTQVLSFRDKKNTLWIEFQRQGYPSRTAAVLLKIHNSWNASVCAFPFISNGTEVVFLEGQAKWPKFRFFLFKPDNMIYSQSTVQH